MRRDERNNKYKRDQVQGRLLCINSSREPNDDVRKSQICTNDSTRSQNQNLKRNNIEFQKNNEQTIEELVQVCNNQLNEATKELEKLKDVEDISKIPNAGDVQEGQPKMKQKDCSCAHTFC